MIVKVCGMRKSENIQKVIDLQPDWIGFIFYPKSPRYVFRNQTGDLGYEELLISSPVKKVGVFVNATQEEMMDKANLFKLDYLQLHGNESPVVCYNLQKRGYRIIKVFSVASAEDIANTQEYEGRADYFLFDTKCSEYGGSGQLFDWSVLKSYTGNTPFLLSGGINPESIYAIRQFTHPRLAGVDLNSGFEIAPAIKDTHILSSFIQEIRKIK